MTAITKDLVNVNMPEVMVILSFDKESGANLHTCLKICGRLFQSIVMVSSLKFLANIYICIMTKPRLSG